jgi:hypothetical protein
MIRVTRTWTIGSKNGYLLCTKNQTSPEKMDSVAVAMPSTTSIHKLITLSYLVNDKDVSREAAVE